jgi:alpha-glucoside transport system permease protein
MATATGDMAGTQRQTLAGRMASAVARGPLHVFLIFIALVWLTPVLGLAISSLRSVQDFSESGWWTAFTHPNQITTESYKTLVDDPNLIGALFNTVKIVLPASILVVVVAALAAYAFSWIEWRGRDVAFILVVALLVVPLQMALIPAARLFGNIGIFGTVWAAILFHVAFGLPFAIFLLRNFFIGIPRDLLEAARIDGASEWQIFRTIVMPLGMPAIAALAIFQFIWTWNDLLIALVFAPGSSAPLNVYIRSLMREYGTNIDIIAPGAFISMIIPVIIFFVFQRYFVEGLLAGSIK